LGVSGLGADKSSLMQGLIGEMIHIGGELSFGGGVAYYAQTTWIRNATVVSFASSRLHEGFPSVAHLFISAARECALWEAVRIGPLLPNHGGCSVCCLRRFWNQSCPIGLVLTYTSMHIRCCYCLLLLNLWQFTAVCERNDTILKIVKRKQFKQPGFPCSILTHFSADFLEYRRVQKRRSGASRP
jgi:hypothetical protein